MTYEGRRTSLRDRYNAFIEKHEVAWELTIAAIVVAWIALGFAGEGQPVAIVVELVLTLTLAAEFITRLAASYDRRAYLRGHWIDGVALIPLPLIRGFRLLRLLRLLRLVRAFSGVYRSLVAIERFATNRQLVWLYTAWLGVACDREDIASALRTRAIARYVDVRMHGSGARFTAAAGGGGPHRVVGRRFSSPWRACDMKSLPMPSMAR